MSVFHNEAVQWSLLGIMVLMHGLHISMWRSQIRINKHASNMFRTLGDRVFGAKDKP